MIDVMNQNAPMYVHLIYIHIYHLLYINAQNNVEYHGLAWATQLHIAMHLVLAFTHDNMAILYWKEELEFECFSR
jgi:hypothetical protein